VEFNSFIISFQGLSKEVVLSCLATEERIFANLRPLVSKHIVFVILYCPTTTTNEWSRSSWAYFQQS